MAVKKKGRKVHFTKLKKHVRQHKNPQIHLTKNQAQQGAEKHKTAVVHPPPRQPVKRYEEEEEDSDHGEDMLEMMDNEDLDFLKSSVANRSYSILNEVPDRIKKKKKKRPLEDDDSIEQNYENIAQGDFQNKRTKYLLPIKTKEGLVFRTTEEDILDEENEREEPVDKKGAKLNTGLCDSDEEFIQQELKGLDDIQIDKAVSVTDLWAHRAKLLQKKKFKIGILCNGILEDPEAKVANFKELLQMMQTKNLNIGISLSKLATVSLLEVFKDLLPSYQIKHQEAPGIKLKKQTIKLQGFEKAMLKWYKIYLQSLEKMAQELKKKDNVSLDSVHKRTLGELAVSCMCDLLVTHPYFNFSMNVAQVLVTFLNHWMESVRQTVMTHLQTVFKNDKKGEISLHIVRCINRLVKSHSHGVHCEVVRVLLNLRIKEVNLDKEKEDEIKKKKFMTYKQKLLRMSRKERKKSKKIEELEKELLETKAEENKQKKEHLLTEMTKVVFTIFFRVLKTAPKSRILSAALEGIAKFAHCINLDFYHDLVSVMDRIVDDEYLGCREELLCVQTVFKILSGQGEALNIDPFRFYTHLYRNLLKIHAGRTYAEFPVLLECLEVALIRCGKHISRERLLAFTKRLSMLSLQVPHNGSLACLALVKRILQFNKTIDLLLDPDTTVGEGVFLPELEEPEYCNASNSALWELCVLQRHYHPVVQKFPRHIFLGCPAIGEGSLPLDISKLALKDLYTNFDPSEMAFCPPVPAPKEVNFEGRVQGHSHFQSKELEDYIKQVTEGVMDENCAKLISQWTDDV